MWPHYADPRAGPFRVSFGLGKPCQSSNMPAPYSDDLRWRMIYQRLFYNRHYDEIASQLFVSARTVMRTFRTFINTGDVKPCRFGRSTGSTTLFPHEEYIIMDCLLSRPQMQLHEISNYIFNATGSSFGVENLCRAVHRLGITRKKVSEVWSYYSRLQWAVL